MDTFMCSSWYHLRYLSPDFEGGPFDPEEYAYWMPVDTYTGGAEHATMHLIYTRFFHKASRDMGVTTGPEPMIQYRAQGQILGPDGQRMNRAASTRRPGSNLRRRYRARLPDVRYRGPKAALNTENIQGRRALAEPLGRSPLMWHLRRRRSTRTPRELGA
jgi:hypothetical protein